MGKKSSKTTTYVTTTTYNTVVKLTYLQTLALNASLGKVEDLETQSKQGAFTTVSDKTQNLNTPIDTLFGKGKSTKVSVKQDTTGAKIADQWLHPYFDRIRYAIGVKDVKIASYKYNDKSEVVSVPFISPKEIIKIYISVDEFIPSTFDQNKVWIEYYIKVEGTNNWVRINPMNSSTKFDSTGEIIPKIINLNVPKPSNAQIEEKYQTTNEPVKKIRFKAVLSRPTTSDTESMTPVLKQYKLFMFPR